LSQNAGGWGLCRDPKTRTPVTVFADTNDIGYRQLLAVCTAGRAFLDRDKRFDMAGFRPRVDWIREMKRFGVLPVHPPPDTWIDVYGVEKDYWKTLWYQPSASLAGFSP
jgi:hypothetical protein